MAEFGLAPGPAQDPVGGFLQGAERGISLIDVLRKRHRDIQLENQKDTLEVAKLIQELGVDRARAVAQQAGLEVDESIFTGGPTEGAEARKTALGTVSPEEFAGVNRGELPGPMGQEKSETIKNLITALAAKSSARSRFGALSEATLRAAKNDTEQALTATMKEIGSYSTRAAARPDLAARVTLLQEQLAGINESLGATLGVPALGRPKPGGSPSAPAPTKTREQRLAELKAKSAF